MNKKNKNSIIKVLSELDFVVAGIALVVLILTTFLGVPMRYFFNHPFVWLEEVQSACLVWIVFGAAGGAFRTGNHVAIEMVVDKFPIKVQKTTYIIIAIIITIVVGYLFIQSIGFIEMFARSGRATPILKVPYMCIYILCPISFLIQIISSSSCLVKEWPTIGQKKEEETDYV